MGVAGVWGGSGTVLSRCWCSGGWTLLGVSGWSCCANYWRDYTEGLSPTCGQQSSRTPPTAIEWPHSEMPRGLPPCRIMLPAHTSLPPSSLEHAPYSRCCLLHSCSPPRPTAFTSLLFLTPPTHPPTSNLPTNRSRASASARLRPRRSASCARPPASASWSPSEQLL